jgi:hypothetical protein
MNKKNDLSAASTGRPPRTFRWPASLTVFLAMCSLAAVAAFLGNGALFYEPLINAYVPPMATAPNAMGEPADGAVAKKYGQINHTAMMPARGDYESNPGPAAIAAYDAPPH